MGLVIVMGKKFSPWSESEVISKHNIVKVRYKYLELIWYLKDTIKIPVFT